MGFFLFARIIMSTIKKQINKSFWKELGLHVDTVRHSTFKLADIAELVRQAKKNGTPYTILTGAGCSQSAGIPLAVKLVEEMNQKFSVQLSNLTKEDRENYNKCMNALTHQERRQLLQDHIKKADINWAHIGLAALMEAGFTQRVLTFNFDNILMRACGLIGLYPAIYDFTNADVNLQNLIIDPAIIYLHGQSYGFRQLNDESETQNHANNMTNFIAQTLNTSPVIVAGYSGYNDGFFEQIDKHYCGEQRLFWIGYKKEIPEHLQNFFKKYKNHAHYIGGHDADDFFVSLMQNLECSPNFFTQHAQHTLDVLNKLTDFPVPNSDNSIDILGNLRQQMTMLAEQDLSLLAKLHNMMMEGKYINVIEIVEKKYGQVLTDHDTSAIDDETKYIYAWAKMTQLNEEWSTLGKEDLSYDNTVVQQIFNCFEQLEKLQPAMYELYLTWGNRLSDIAYLEASLELYDKSSNKYNKAINIQNDRAEAYGNLGKNLLDLAEFKQDESYSEQALEQLLIAEKIDFKNVYNLACVYSRLDQLGYAKKKLMVCKENQTLPPKNHLLNDPDLDLLRQETWFNDFISNL